jgi:hypothetical protein
VVEEVLAPLSDLLAGSHVSEAENSG